MLFTISLPERTNKFHFNNPKTRKLTFYKLYVNLKATYKTDY
jgi:hypothetical protein